MGVWQPFLWSGWRIWGCEGEREFTLINFTLVEEIRAFGESLLVDYWVWALPHCWTLWSPLANSTHYTVRQWEHTEWTSDKIWNQKPSEWKWCNQMFQLFHFHGFRSIWKRLKWQFAQTWTWRLTSTLHYISIIVCVCSWNMAASASATPSPPSRHTDATFTLQVFLLRCVFLLCVAVHII